ncbi:MAG TPA: PilZ domain-containing protein [Candidatus Acidoferrales bacterium]|nr:PilZ domain-containing protein [Candidatus Acidoferrales bacterium]
MPSASDTLSPITGTFVHSLNLLLKFARLYGLHHIRTTAQMEYAWNDLYAALDAAGPSGILLGVSGSELLIDGALVESTATEHSLAQLLTQANIASIGFMPGLSRGSFSVFVQTFSAASLKPSHLAKRLKSALGDGSDSGIRINQLRFVAREAELPTPVVSARISGKYEEESHDWLHQSEKLIELIASVEHSGKATSGYHFGEELLGTAHLSENNSLAYTHSEEEMRTLLQFAANLGEAAHKSRRSGAADVSEWKQRIADLPAASRAVLVEAFAEMNTAQPSRKLNAAAILYLAEGLAVRYVSETFQRGNLKVNRVRPLLEAFAVSLGPLGEILRAHDRKASKTAHAFNSHADTLADALDRRFWSSLPESEKQSILFSSEGWRVPPEWVRQSVDGHFRNSDFVAADKILAQYAKCIRDSDTEARTKSAIGLAQMAELYARASTQGFHDAIRIIGEQLAVERDVNVRDLLNSAFVRFSQVAAEQTLFPALRQAFDTLAILDKSQPNSAHALRPRIGIKNRIPGFIEKGLKSEVLRTELIEVLRHSSQAAAEQLATRLIRVTRSGEREQVVAMARALGKPAQEYLCQTLENAPPANGVRVLGLLSRIDPACTQQLLPGKIQAGQSATHDEVLRQLSIASAPERGRMLMSIVGRMDRMILPMALDEIGMCGDASVASDLLRLAEGNLLKNSSDFLRVKAIEALGRLRAPETTMHLMRFIEARRAWRWIYPCEMRLAAAQALEKLEPEHARNLLAESGLDPHMLSLAPLDARRDRDFVRYRRYPRVKMAQPVPAIIQSKRGTYQPAVQVLSLEGGLLSGDFQLAVGAAANLQISPGKHPIHLDVLVRFAQPNQAGVEMVGMDLEDRSRLRTLLVSMAAATLKPQSLPLPA